MKQRRNAFIQLLILTALAAAVVLTLTLPRLPFTGRGEEPTAVSVILRQADATLWSAARQGMEQAAGELRAELRILTLSADNAAAEQAQLLEYEIDRGAAALVVVPAGPLAADVGAPVITMESADAAALALVGPDNAALGRALAEAMLADDPDGPVLLVDPASASAGVADRLAAARETLEAAGVTIKTARLEGADWAAQMANALAGAHTGRALLPDAASTEAAADAKQQLSLEMELYGVGAGKGIVARLEQGMVDASAVWSEFAAGYLAVEKAVQAARGEACADEALPVTILRGEDIYEPDNQKLLFPVAG